MGWASYVQEILRVSAPVLVFLALLVNSSATSSRGCPLALKLLLDGAWKLPEVDWIRGKNSEEEWSLLLFFVGRVLRVWNNHVMNWFLLMFGQQSTCLRDFTLSESLKSRRCFEHNVTLTYFPKPITFGFDSHHNKVHGDVVPLRNLFVLLHQTDYEGCLFGHRDSELWVVEPSVIGVVFGALAVLLFFRRGRVDWVWSTGRVAVPLLADRVLGPRRWEDFAQVQLVEVGAEIVVPHPPVAVILEDVVELFLQTFVIVPSLIFVSKLACPFALAPRIANSDKLQVVDLLDLLDTVGVVEEDSGVAHAFFLMSLLVFDGVGGTKEEALLVPFLEILPELTAIDELGSFWSSQMELFSDATRKINEGFVHGATVEHLVSTVQLGISLLHQTDPELSEILAITVERSLGLRVVWDTSINDNMLPLTVFEELEDSESILDTIVDNQVVQKLGVCALNKKRSEEPAVSQNTLFDITGAHGVSVHFGFSVGRSDLLRSLPLDVGHIHGVLWKIDWVVVEGCIIGRKLGVTE